MQDHSLPPRRSLSLRQPLSRRQALLTGAAAVAGTCVNALGSAADRAVQNQPFLLSDKGCGRASAYVEANKCVTFADKTHVAWLDSGDGNFQVRIRTLDHRSREWSPTYTVGQAHDNHGGPALSVDSRGFLHIVYYPHHHAFRYRQSRRPNDASTWTDETLFGEKLTYPTLMCGTNDTLYLTARRSLKNEPWLVERWMRPAGKDWQGPHPIIRSGAGGYSHFQEALAWSPDRKTLHLSCRIYQNGGAQETVAYMRSHDFGVTWRRLDDSPIPLPATPQTMDVIASGGRVEGLMSHKCGSVAVDPAGVPHVLYSAGGSGKAEMLIAKPDGRGGWQRRPLAKHVTDKWPGWRIGPAAAMVFNQKAVMFVTATISREEQTEVVRLTSRDQGRSFSMEMVSQGLKGQRKMWPNLEHPTGHNVIANRPGVLFAAGDPGQRNDDILSNNVYWAG